MIFTATKLKGAYVVELEKKSDNRGFFARAWCQKEFESHGLVSQFVQSNVSWNEKKGTLRGMHRQAPPYGEAKLIRCTRGAIYDVILDVRRDSETFGQWVGVELTEENHRSLFVPAGFAVGFQTLEDNSEILYFMSEFYAPGAEEGIRYNDPAFAIAWPGAVTVISEKDKTWPDYSAKS
jgi:dTDP-4-dehydrorhamnose 3,5-epimerase